MKNQNKKTNYRLNLEAEQKVRKLKKAKNHKGEEVPDFTYKVSETTPYEFLSYSSGEVVKARKDAKVLEKMNNKTIKAFDFDTKDGKKIVVSIPQRLQFLNEEPKK